MVLFVLFPIAQFPAILCNFSFSDDTFTIIHLEGTNGTFKSDGYPQNYYTPNTHTRWIIRAPIGYVINLHFAPEFQLERAMLSPSCYDSVNVFEDSSLVSSLVCSLKNTPDASYCGLTSPDDYTSEESEVVIEFCTDYNIEMFGFQITWTTMLRPTRVPAVTPDQNNCGVPSSIYQNDIIISPDGKVEPNKAKIDPIVDGSETQPHSWPWAVAIFEESTSIKQFCGGTLIAPNWVLTAAHCFHGQQNIHTHFWVKLGAQVKQASFGDPTLPNESTQQVCRILNYFENPGYNGGAHTGDMGLLQLNCTVIYTDAIKPACLPSRNDNRPFDGEYLVTVGWGSKQSEGKDSMNLQEVILKQLNQQTCNIEYGQRIDDTMFCLETAGKDACQGDSGGGAFSYVDKKWQVTGIVSWGIGCARPKYAGVYVQVTTMLEWLWETIITN